ncbi:MAG TPA: SET domain-containing protein-lysine N-methyltransferase [Pseudonocardiaceae bacterium]|jgi:hypothetical protein
MIDTDGCAVESRPVAVIRFEGEYRLFAREPVPSGTSLFKVDGVLTDVPTRYSVQVGRSVHLDVSASCTSEEIMDRFYWRFTNHSCEPNSMLRGREFLALTPIEPWQEITFNYNTTEYELAEPFDCRCGSIRCVGRVEGFRSLRTSERERLRPWLADHLLSLFAG